jgi:hypothetical protein
MRISPSYSICIAFLAFIYSATASLSAEKEASLIKNGDFEDGMRRWTGPVLIETIDGNKVAAITAGPSKKILRQGFNRGVTKSVTIKFRYMASEDFKGKKFTLQVDTDDVDTGTSSTWKEIPIKKKGQWKTESMDFDRFKKLGSPSLCIIVDSGKGKIYFDDFSVVPSKD